MPSSFRLGPLTEGLLERLARTRDVSKSQIVREAVAAYGEGIDAAESAPTLHARLESSLGKFPTGGLDLSVDSGAKVEALLRSEYEADQLVVPKAIRKRPLTARPANPARPARPTRLTRKAR